MWQHHAGGHTAKLRKVLNELGVICYYTFSVKGFEENHAVFTPNSRSLQEQHEEKILGKLNKEDETEFLTLLRGNNDRATAVKKVLHGEKHTFRSNRPECAQSARNRQKHDFCDGRYYTGRQTYSGV